MFYSPIYLYHSIIICLLQHVVDFKLVKSVHQSTKWPKKLNIKLILFINLTSQHYSPAHHYPHYYLYSACSNYEKNYEIYCHVVY